MPEPQKLPFFVDTHRERLVEAPIEQVQGWGRLHVEHKTVTATCAGHDLRMARVPRPDVEKRGLTPYFGFSFFLDLPVLTTVTDAAANGLDIEFHDGDERLAGFHLDVAPKALEACKAIAANRIVKARFVAKHSRHKLATLAGCNAPSALPLDWSISADIRDKTDPVSAHIYGKVVHEFIRDIGPGKFILDAGAGLRRWPHENIVNMEIYDYPSTDILAIGQELPFKDNSFDAAISIAVLEHVDDPFKCAKELIRVVKPGGKIFAIVPFLQAEHGYPSHFFNATRFGLRKLFSEGTTLEKHFIEMSNHPVFTLHQVLGLYMLGLPPELREKFLDAPIRTFLDKLPGQLYMNKNQFVANLSEDAQWVLASGTTAVFVKQ